MTGDHATRPLSHAHPGPSSRLPEWGADAGEAERAHGASRTRGGEARRGSPWQGRVLRQGVGRAGAPHSEPGRRGAGPARREEPSPVTSGDVRAAVPRESESRQRGRRLP